jgi:predicted enzyme related to lactoylglutathione lyase
MKIGLTGIHVNNPSEAYKFYTEVLGFITKMYIGEANLAIVASPEQPDGTNLLLEPVDNPIGKAYQEGLYTSDIPAIVFVVDDIQNEFVKLTGKGVVFRKEPTKTEWGIEAIFDDTCGNLIQLHQE